MTKNKQGKLSLKKKKLSKGRIHKYAFSGNEQLQKYIDENIKQTKLAKEAINKKNNEIARKTSRDALESIVDADIYINQHKTIAQMDIKLINKVHELYKKTEILIKSIYGDERPHLTEDSIAGDYY
jgi:hypothetical protein